MKVTCIVEQPRNEPYRVRYEPSAKAFIKTEFISLMHARNFMGVYGWVADSGTPPDPHFDILIATNEDFAAGEVIDAHVCGMYLREDGDHKVLALADDVIRANGVSEICLSQLPEVLRSNFLGVYPYLNLGEAWLNAAEAIQFLHSNLATSGD